MSQPVAPPPAKPFQFSLRQLLVLIFVCSCAMTLIFYWGWIGFGICYAIACLAALGWSISRPDNRGLLIGISLLVMPLIGLIFDSSHTSGPPPYRMYCGNHLKQIGLALQNYHDVCGEFPPAYIADSTGRPMHSWRVLILPFMEHKNLYDTYRFDEPWDGPNNRKLHNQIIDAYCCPACAGNQPQTETSYLVIVGPRTMWPGDKNTKLTDVADGTSNTIMVVEVHNSGIHWMDPRDLHVGQMPLTINVPHGTGISSPHRNGANALFVDGHTQFLRDDLSPGILRGLLTIGGGEKLGDF